MSTSFQEKVGAIENCLLRHLEDKALQLIEDMSPHNDFETKIMLHLMARAHMQKGHYDAAETLIRRCQESLGENILQLCDLMAIQYQRGQSWAWRASLPELKSRLESNRHMLSVDSFVQSTNLIGKFSEEDGHVSEAINHYEMAHAAAIQAGRRDLQILTQAQVLRAQAYFDSQNHELGKHYQDLVSLAGDNMTPDLHAEVQHSLMLSEIELVGVEGSWLRIETRLKETPLQDQILFVFDYIIETLLRGLSPVREALTIAAELQKHLSSEQILEQTLITYIKAPEPKTLDHALSVSNHKLSWATQLRLSCLGHLNHPEYGEFLKRLQLMLRPLSNPSREIWMKRLKSQVFSDRINLKFNPKIGLVEWQERSINFYRKKTALHLLELLTENTDHSVDDVLHRIWQAPYSLENIHRLRMTIHRLNEDLYNLTAVPKIVELNSDRVKLTGVATLQLT